MNEAVRRLHVPPPSIADRPRAFADALALAKGKHLLIPLRGHPDPDGIACALAQAHIAHRLGVGKITISYSHELSHRENRALVKLLNIELTKIRNLKDLDPVDYLGLATDTDDFSLARAVDFRAAGQLSDIADRDLLSDLSRRLIAPSAMDIIARSLASLVVRRNFAMAGVGFVPDTERDTIAQAADFLVRREDIDTVVVFGVVGDRHIEGSLRTHSASVDPAAWLEQAFGTDDRGRPFGGGRRDKGGFRIPIGFLGRGADRGQLWTLVENAMRQALLRQLGTEEGNGGVGAVSLPAQPPTSA